MLIGRRPTADRSLPDGPLRLITLCEPTVSRVHALVTVQPWRCSVRDLGSTNGTTVHRSGFPRHRLSIGEIVDLEPGARVDLGGGIGFTVELDRR